MSNLAQAKRAELSLRLLLTRGPICERCRIKRVLNLAEGFVSRGDVQGWSIEDRVLIFHEYNCFLLCQDYCHKNYGFDRQWFWDKSCERYGEEKVREWYDGLPWKAGVPRRFWDGD